MPVIQQYNSRVDLQGTQIEGKQAEPNQYNPLQQIDQGIHNAGEMATAVALRAEQEDVSDLHVNAAQAQEYWVKEVQNRAQKGPIDLDQLHQDVQDYFEQNVRSKVNTPAGQNLYKQMSANLHLDLMTSAFKANHVLAGEQAVGKFQQGVEASGNAVMANPASYQASIDNQEAYLQALVKTQGLPASEVPKLRNHANSQLSIAYYRGMIKNQMPEQAEKLLNDPKEPANQYVDQHQKYQLLQEVKAQKHANTQDVRLKQEIAEHAHRLQQEQNHDKIVKGILSGAMTQDAILNTDLNPHVRESLAHLNENRVKLAQIPQWGPEEQQIYSRIHADDSDPNKIRDEQALMSATQGKVSPMAVSNLMSELQNAKDPKNQAISTAKRQLFEYALKKLNPAGLNAGGIPDVAGTNRMKNFMSQFQAAMQDTKLTPQQLLTPPTASTPNPNWVGKYVEMNMGTPADHLNHQAVQIKRSSPALSGEPIKRKAGESTKAFLERVAAQKAGQ